MVSKPRYPISGQYSLSTFRCQLSAARCPGPQSRNPDFYGLSSNIYHLSFPPAEWHLPALASLMTGTEILRFVQNDPSGGQPERLSSIFYLLSSVF